MTINNNSVEQINVALLDMDKKLKSAASKSASASDFKNLEASVDNIKRTLNETKTGLEPGKTYNINISGNAATADKAKEAEKANKLVNALTVNGETYDGSEAVDAGVQTVENGGTGATDAKNAFMNLANGLSECANPEDTERIIFQNSSGKDWGLYTLSHFWEYIKGKISSVLGLTKDNYGGKAASAGNADTVDNYHANNLWRSDGANWNPNANVLLDAAANGDEWSFDISRNGHTGCYWHVWDSSHGSLLKVNADDGKVSAPYGFVGNLSGKADTAGTADKTVNDITIDIPYVTESGQYVIPLGNILQPGSEEYNSPYNWDIAGFFSLIRPSGHAGCHITFEAGHGYSHGFTTYAYLDEDNFKEVGYMGMSIKAFQYNGEWWLGLWISTQWQGYYSKMTVTYSRGLPATPTCILYNSVSDGVANEEIYNSIQDIPSWWWRGRTIYNPTTFTQNITSPVVQANNKMVIPIGAPSSLEDGCIWIER